MSMVPTKIASNAGMTEMATILIGFLKIADAKNMFMPAGGHKNPISILAKKMMNNGRIA